MVSGSFRFWRSLLKLAQFPGQLVVPCLVSLKLRIVGLLQEAFLIAKVDSEIQHQPIHDLGNTGLRLACQHCLMQFARGPKEIPMLAVDTGDFHTVTVVPLEHTASDRHFPGKPLARR
jgi:hypothetical protein